MKINHSPKQPRSLVEPKKKTQQQQDLVWNTEMISFHTRIELLKKKKKN